MKACLHRAAAVLLVMPLAVPVQAHTEIAAGGGFVRGFLHPLGGGDHLLAMVAVGIWGAVLGAPLLWLLPVTFPLLMVLGALAAIGGVALPAVEPGVAASVLVLGAAIAAFWRARPAAALVVVGFFGFLHGYAHGAELPEAASPAAYACGFVLASGLLHGTGIAIGTARSLPRGEAVLRGLGGA
ncbi:MAG: HupE/UreJ family protein, partial [Ramlibacter sp.]